MQKSFVFDIKKCTGCEACQLACSIENVVDPRISWRRVYTFNPRRRPGVASFHFSLACNHCVDPSCLKYCPALAYTKDPATGAVTIDADKCIGCKYCSWACPFDVPQFNHATGAVEKCTFCAHRIEAGLEPACVAMCPTTALRYGELDEEQVTRIPGLPPTRIGPAIRFDLSPKLEGGPVCSAASPRGEGVGDVFDTPPARIGLRSEWTLMAFTFLASLLVGAYTSTVLKAPAAQPSILAERPFLLALAGIAGMALSTRHLGRRHRAWRAVLNLRRSWLSREVILFPIFLVTSTASLILDRTGDAAAWACAVVGFLALFAMDRVYDVTGTRGLLSHSAQVFLTGMLFAVLLAGNITAFGIGVVVKTVLYLGRKYQFLREQRDYHPWLTRARVLIGLVLPLLFWWKASPAWYPFVVAGVLVGEIIDRCEFYLELDAPGPAKQMDVDLREYLSRGDGIPNTNL